MLSGRPLFPGVSRFGVLATRGQTDMRGLVTCRMGFRLERRHCLQNANVASPVDWLFIGLSWVRSSRGCRVDGNPGKSVIISIGDSSLDRRALRRCLPGRLACPVVDLAGGRGGCGVKGGRRPCEAIAAATLEAGGTAAQAARRSTPARAGIFDESPAG